VSRRLEPLLVTGLIVPGFVLSALLCLYLLLPVPAGFLRGDEHAALTIEDRNGVPLREVRSSRYGVCHWVRLDEVNPEFVSALVLREDRRFYSHPGVDLLAMARSVRDAVKAGHVVSGGSTITQQLVRNLYPPRRRTVAAKVWEMVEAVRLELHLSKRQILEAYVNRVPFGNQTYGVEAASRLYFNRSPAELSLAQSCVLAVLPGQPVMNEPFRHYCRSVRLGRGLLERLRASGSIDFPACERAVAESVVTAPARHLFRAPHFSDYVLAELERQGVHSGGRVRTTLDYRTQQRCEELLFRQVSALASHHVTNGAVVVLDRRTGAVRAMVGSTDYFAPDAGQVNAALSQRQPGSAIKPFAYACGFERKMTPATILADVPFHFVEPGGDYSPSNYDRKYHGPVSCRTALACSYNIPAVRMTAYVGPDELLEHLRRCGMSRLDRRSSKYGLALGLGVADVTLLELTNAYRVLANLGRFSTTRALESFTGNDGSVKTFAAAESREVFSPVASWLVTDILSDDQARAPAFGEFSCLALPFPCAVKTGTSKDYRDNLTLGYTLDYVVGVWLGNFDNSAMHRVSGITGAGPLFRDIMLSLHEREPGQFTRPDGLMEVAVCPQSGRRPGRFCPNGVVECVQEWNADFETCAVHRLVRVDRRTGMQAGPDCPLDAVDEQVVEVWPPEFRPWMESEGRWFDLPALASTTTDSLAVLFPDDGDVFKIDPDLNRDFQSIALRALVPAGCAEVSWSLDGRSMGKVGPPFTLLWNLAPGRHEVRVETAGSASEPVSFLVIP